MRGRRKVGFWFRFAVMVLKPLLLVVTRRDWRGREHLPTEGGVVVCVNHISYVDPLVLAHFLYDNGRLPRYLAKAGLFRLPLVGAVVRGAQQIPVHRESRDAAGAFRDAVAAVRRGECVVVYPEGTVTRDPGLWPMVGKTGAARIALSTGAPVVPIAQWGAQRVLPPYARRPRLWPPTLVHVTAGPPVDLTDLAGRELTAELLAEATERIMAALTALLEQIRGEAAPATRFDVRRARLPRTGDPRRPAASGEVRPPPSDGSAGAA